MMKTYVCALFLYGLWLPLETQAQPSAGDPKPLRTQISMSLYRGTCQNLSTPDGDVSEACAPAMIANRYSDGFVGYGFIRVDPATHAQAAISFLGGSKGMTPGTIELEGVLLNTADGDKSFDARGTCTLAGPEDGVQSVNCEATTDDGMYTATFVTDGSKPQVRNMAPSKAGK